MSFKAFIRDLEFRPAFVIVSAQILLLTLLYFGSSGYFNRNFAGLFQDYGQWRPLMPYAYYYGMSVLLRMLLPMAFIYWPLRGRLADYGYSFRGALAGLRSYAWLGLAMLPIVWYASSLPSFQRQYPMFRPALQGNTLQWETFLAHQALYAMLFVSGESFWRGYILFGLERKFGNYAILIMTVPYSMSHYGVLAFGTIGKPYLETIGAIVAGTILGYLALRHRTFWPGVALHLFVALLMDISAILRKIS